MKNVKPDARMLDRSRYQLYHLGMFINDVPFLGRQVRQLRTKQGHSRQVGWPGWDVRLGRHQRSSKKREIYFIFSLNYAIFLQVPRFVNSRKGAMIIPDFIGKNVFKKYAKFRVICHTFFVVGQVGQTKWDVIKKVPFSKQDEMGRRQVGRQVKKRQKTWDVINGRSLDEKSQVLFWSFNP